jgi:hypothetical protein
MGDLQILLMSISVWGESTILESVRHFVRSVVEIYGPHYLRLLTAQELDMVLQKGESCGCSDMIGNIDCMH